MDGYFDIESCQRLQRVGSALRKHLDRAVCQISRDAADSEPFSLDTRAVPEEHALNLAAHSEPANDLAQGENRRLAQLGIGAGLAEAGLLAA